jgi:hypothetical protein
LDKLEQRVIDSIIEDSLLSPHIAVINNHQDFADKFVVKLHSHLKTAGINIGNALPITVDLKNIDELDKVIKLLIGLYPNLHILYIDRNVGIILIARFFFLSFINFFFLSLGFNCNVS